MNDVGCPLAMKQYNGVPLDGRSMKIEMAASDIPAAVRPREASRRRSYSVEAPRRRGGAGGAVYRIRGGGVQGYKAPRGRRGVRGARGTRGTRGSVRGTRGAAGGVRGGRGRGRARGRGGRGGAKPTAEALDKELDAYQSGR